VRRFLGEAEMLQRVDKEEEFRLGLFHGYLKPVVSLPH
jgi:hypothetical protein